MGNRAVITTRAKDIGIYLHWNGGRDSVNGFLAYANMTDQRTPEYDCYGWARLCQIICNVFEDAQYGMKDGKVQRTGSKLGTCSVGIARYDDLDTDNGDNGVYIIEGWKIVDREFKVGEEQMTYPLLDFLLEVDEAQPQKLGKEFITKWVEEHGKEYN